VKKDTSGVCTAKKAKLFTGVANKPFWMSERKNDYDYIYDARFKAEGGGEDINYNYLNKFGMYCFLRGGIHSSNNKGQNWYHPSIKANKREVLKLQGKACSPEEMAAAMGYRVMGGSGNIINVFARLDYLNEYEVRQGYNGLNYSYSEWLSYNGLKEFDFRPRTDGDLYHMPVVKIDGRLCNESMLRDVNGKPQTRNATNKAGLPTICGDDLDDVISTLAPRPEFPPIPDSEVRVLAPR
jgi:hypothetical protein